MRVVAGDKTYTSWPPPNDVIVDQLEASPIMMRDFAYYGYQKFKIDIVGKGTLYGEQLICIDPTGNVHRFEISNKLEALPIIPVEKLTYRLDLLRRGTQWKQLKSQCLQSLFSSE